MNSELRNVYREYLTLMDVALKEYEDNRKSITNRDWHALSLSCSKLAILAHKIAIVDEKLEKLKKEYCEDLFENND